MNAETSRCVQRRKRCLLIASLCVQFRWQMPAIMASAAFATLQQMPTRSPGSWKRTTSLGCRSLGPTCVVSLLCVERVCSPALSSKRIGVTVALPGFFMNCLKSAIALRCWDQSVTTVQDPAASPNPDYRYSHNVCVMRHNTCHISVDILHSTLCDESWAIDCMPSTTGLSTYALQSVAQLVVTCIIRHARHDIRHGHRVMAGSATRMLIYMTCCLSLSLSLSLSIHIYIYIYIYIHIHTYIHTYIYTYIYIYIYISSFFSGEEAMCCA